MDKGVLLVLLCLQVFLLTSAFSSADAAVLRRDDQEQLLADQEVLLLNREKSEQKPKQSGCWQKPGGCSAIESLDLPDPSPTIKLLPKRSGCWRMPGGCSVFGKVRPPTSPLDD
ncbi:uncharacterized protein LOC144405524 isoform X1 [Gasterosteus aculeatus]